MFISGIDRYEYEYNITYTSVLYSVKTHDYHVTIISTIIK